MINKSYEVGYCKPPKATQFQKGVSGNPKGRTKRRQQDMIDLIEQELKTKINLTDGTCITKEQAIARQLANGAAKGDPRSQKLLFGLQQKSIHRKKSEQLFQKLLREGYLTEEKIDNFLYHNQVLSSNRTCEPIKCSLNLNAMFKQHKGRLAFADAVMLSDMSSQYMYQLILEDVCNSICCEYEYWAGVDAVTSYLNLSAVDKERLSQDLAKSRSMARPTTEQYEKSQKIAELLGWGLLKRSQQYMQILRQQPEFEKSERDFLEGKIQVNILKDIENLEEVSSLKEELCYLKSGYQVAQRLPSADKCQKRIKELAINEQEAMQILSDLLKPKVN